MTDGLQEVMSAGAAAGRLEVSPSGLRRLAIIYGSVHGELPREPKTNNRVWPVEAVERLEQARALVEAERYHSIREALEALGRGERPDMTVPTVELAHALSEPSARELLGVLIEESRAVRAELKALHSDNERLQEQILELSQSRVLESPQAAPQDASTPLLVRVAVRVDSWLRRFRQ